jgi:hypothetical protein
MENYTTGLFWLLRDETAENRRAFLNAIERKQRSDHDDLFFLAIDSNDVDALKTILENCTISGNNLALVFEIVVEEGSKGLLRVLLDFMYPQDLSHDSLAHAQDFVLKDIDTLIELYGSYEEFLVAGGQEYGDLHAEFVEQAYRKSTEALKQDNKNVPVRELIREIADKHMETLNKVKLFTGHSYDTEFTVSGSTETPGRLLMPIIEAEDEELLRYLMHKGAVFTENEIAYAEETLNNQRLGAVLRRHWCEDCN